jgi:nucleoside-diphosphate-sugar epimerase
MDVVTGAFGYTGRVITQRLLEAGRAVRTLTAHPDPPNPFGRQIGVAPLAFDDPSALVRSLRGADVLYNTYWVRFGRAPVSFDQAVENTRVLMEAAQAAAVRRVVHLSITNASSDSHLAYFRGKARAEDVVVGSSRSYAIIRPTVLFGDGDVLINNIAWLVRRLPVFAISGSGRYRVRPVHVDDVAAIAVDAGQNDENVVIDAVGPETYSFEALVRLIARVVRRRPLIVHMPRQIVLGLARIIGVAVHDVLITADELEGLMEGLVTTDGPPTGRLRLSEWLARHKSDVGQVYASEMDRHYRER